MSRIRPISILDPLSQSTHITSAESAPSAKGKVHDSIFILDARHHQRKAARNPLIVQASQLPNLTIQTISAHIDQISDALGRTLSLLDDVVGEKAVTEGEILRIIKEESNLVVDGGKDKIEVIVFDEAVEMYVPSVAPSMVAQGEGAVGDVRFGQRRRFVPLQVDDGVGSAEVAGGAEREEQVKKEKGCGCGCVIA